MFSACLFCNGPLGANDSIESFPIGQRLAFDAKKGRLWVVCPRCARWNLSPLDERWDAIDQCERAYRSTTLRVSTGNIGLARLGDGLELVRIGAPLRPEFAAWRYGTRFNRRRRRIQFAAGGGVVAAAAVGIAAAPTLAPYLLTGTISIIAIPGLTTIMGAIPMVGLVAIRDYFREDRVVARLPAPASEKQGHAPAFAFEREQPLVVRARQIGSSTLHLGENGSATLHVVHDGGVARYDDTAALQTASVLVASSNKLGATDNQVRRAVSNIERQGDAAGYLASVSVLGAARGRVMSMLNSYRHLGALRLDPAERLALEMAMHEETERRMLDGELALLAAAWKEAEEIAAIADEL
ncbi:MAG TPA: hypothetical protein VJO33_13570 [Gemmatimonadaceae bacterium]|nr:hypothetical protein [Gemmatimonadaceae bacterium]